MRRVVGGSGDSGMEKLQLFRSWNLKAKNKNWCKRYENPRKFFFAVTWGWPPPLWIAVGATHGQWAISRIKFPQKDVDRFPNITNVLRVGRSSPIHSRPRAYRTFSLGINWLRGHWLLQRARLYWCKHMHSHDMDFVFWWEAEAQKCPQRCAFVTQNPRYH